VLSAVETSTTTEPAGELMLKGIHRPVRVFNVCTLLSSPA
jgi:class 3 adenylate cyclase